MKSPRAKRRRQIRRGLDTLCCRFPSDNVYARLFYWLCHQAHDALQPGANEAVLDALDVKWSACCANKVFGECFFATMRAVINLQLVESRDVDGAPPQYVIERDVIEMAMARQLAAELETTS